MDERTQLLLAAREGDRVAFAAFVRQTQADVWRFCASLVDLDSADDLTQEVYVRAMRAVEAFRGESSARTWLMTITRRTCADAIRRRQRQRRLRDRLTPPPPVEDDHASIELDDLLVTLDADRREAFVLTQVLGYRYAEAARIVGVPVGTVRSRVSRAREDLVRALGSPIGSDLTS